MYRFRIGKVESPWDNLVPPIQCGLSRVQEQERWAQDGDGDSGYSSEISESNAEDGAGVSGPISTTDVDAYHTHSAQCIADLIQSELQADLAMYPSLDSATQRSISDKFQALHERVRAEGFYECRPWEYAKEMAIYALLFVLFAFCLHRGWYASSACFLGLWWHQIMFTAHDAGHRALTHNIVVDTLIGIFIGNLCCGLSIGWWKSSHNVHHLVTNHPVRKAFCYLPWKSSLTRCRRSTIRTSRTFRSLLLRMICPVRYVETVAKLEQMRLLLVHQIVLL